MISALIEIGRSIRDLYPMPLVENPYPRKGKDDPEVLVVELNLIIPCGLPQGYLSQ